MCLRNDKEIRIARVEEIMERGLDKIREVAENQVLRSHLAFAYNLR